MTIKIKKSHEGLFTAYKKRTGKTTSEALHSTDSHVRQMANFARNSSRWNHKKCGGKVKKMQDGGWATPEEQANIELLRGMKPVTPNVTSALASTATPGLQTSNALKDVKVPGMDVGKVTGIASTGSDMLTGITSKFGDPNKTGGVGNAVATAGNIVGKGAARAAQGAKMAGAPGAIAGAAVGIIEGGIDAITGGKEKRERLLAQKVAKQKDEITAMGTQMAAEGGKITGKGTAKSDSIKTELEPGSFITPAENAEWAMQIGREHFGWETGQRASMKEGGEVPVAVSNGEVLFTKDETEYLREIGVNIDKLAPKAKLGNQPSSKGNPDVEDEENPKKQKTQIDIAAEQVGYPPKEENTLEKSDSEYKNLQDQNDNYESNTPKNKRKFSKAIDWVKKNPGILLGAGQVGAGIAGIISNDKKMNKLQDVPSSAPTFNTEALQIKQSADKTASQIMQGTEKENANAMGDYLNMVKTVGGNAHAILGNLSKGSEAAAGNYLKAMTEAAKIKMGGTEMAGKLRAEGAVEGTKTDMFNRELKEKRYAQRDQDWQKTLAGGVENIGGQTMLTNYNKRLEDLEKKYKGDITQTAKRGGYVRKYKKVI